MIYAIYHYLHVIGEGMLALPPILCKEPQMDSASVFGLRYANSRDRSGSVRFGSVWDWPVPVPPVRFGLAGSAGSVWGGALGWGGGPGRR